MSERFKSILNDIGLLDTETCKKYIYFNNDFVSFLNKLVKDYDKLNEEKGRLELELMGCKTCIDNIHKETLGLIK